MKSARQQQMEFYLRQQMGARARKPTTNAAPAVKLACTLKADWPLAGSSGDELLLKSSELSSKIKDADIAGQKNAAANLTPEQQEQLEEQQALAQQAVAMSGEAAGDTAASAGGAKITYVATLTDAEHAKAYADAFAGAKSQAQLLAKAAGAELGSLRQLAAQTTMTAEAAASGNDYSAYVALLSGRSGAAGTEVSPTEAVGTQPSNVGVRVTVTAAFALK
jgi:hypothetical protein